MPAPAADADLTRLAINTIKFLSIDAIEKANSGHPGLPLGAADYAFILWSRYLKYDPKDRTWLDRLQPELATRLQELLDDPDG